MSSASTMGRPSSRVLKTSLLKRTPTILLMSSLKTGYLEKPLSAMNLSTPEDAKFMSIALNLGLGTMTCFTVVSANSNTPRKSAASVSSISPFAAPSFIKYFISSLGANTCTSFSFMPSALSTSVVEDVRTLTNNPDILERESSGFAEKQAILSAYLKARVFGTSSPATSIAYEIMTTTNTIASTSDASLTTPTGIAMKSGLRNSTAATPPMTEARVLTTVRPT